MRTRRSCTERSSWVVLHGAIGKVGEQLLRHRRRHALPVRADRLCSGVAPEGGAGAWLPTSPVARRMWRAGLFRPRVCASLRHTDWHRSDRRAARRAERLRTARRGRGSLRGCPGRLRGDLRTGGARLGTDDGRSVPGRRGNTRASAEVPERLEFERTEFERPRGRLQSRRTPTPRVRTVRCGAAPAGAVPAAAPSPRVLAAHAPAAART
jgi:hypothetical protein